jgi:excinuclease ABC subunit C
MRFEEELKRLPNQPGVYIMRDDSDSILYVGKAINLHSRVRSYFRENIGRGAAIDKMVSLVAKFEYIVTDSELEALVLENNLIKEYAPKYNTLLKDGKTYPYIKVTVGETFPRILFSREMKRDKSKYFGPYASAAAVKDTIELLRRLYHVRSCNRMLPKEIGKDRPCLYHHIGQCDAPCQGKIDAEAYRQQITGALTFLNGHYQEVLLDLESQMKEAADRMAFEEAAKLRDLYISVKTVAQKQKMSDSHQEDRDIIALHKQEEEAVVQVFFMRDGKLIGRDYYYMTHVSDKDEAAILGDFVKQFYAGTPYVPRELFLQLAIPDQPLLEDFLSKRRGAKVTLKVPKQGTQERLLELAAKNAKLIFTHDQESMKRQTAKTLGAVSELAKLLSLQQLNRLEAYDISNISGFQNVGSMVVFEQGKPKKSDYRKFRIQSVLGPDDYACMQEVLTRRFRHGIQEKINAISTQLKASAASDSFTKFPDLILMDGGLGQVNIAKQVLETLGLFIPVCGMIKDDHHQTRGLIYENIELPIDRHSEAFKLITRIQDEAHRFAIEYHRSLRSKELVRSTLDQIPGIGSARRKALMRTFTSLEEIKQSDIETLCEVPQIPRRIAEEIYQYFHPQAYDNS